MSNLVRFTKLASLWLATTCSTGSYSCDLCLRVCSLTSELLFNPVIAETTSIQTIYEWLPLQFSVSGSGTTLSGYSQTISIAPIAAGPSGIVTYEEYASVHVPAFGIDGTEDEVEGGE
jgi:hypothetical protein